MWFKKTISLNIRVDPVLKRKFEIATVHTTMSSLINEFMHKYVREFERDTGTIIPVTSDDSIAYEYIKTVLGLKINDSEFEELKWLYPKTRKGRFIR